LSTSTKIAINDVILLPYQEVDSNAVRNFDCGNTGLNRIFKHLVPREIEYGKSETYCLVHASESGAVVGYFTLSREVEFTKSTDVALLKEQYDFSNAMELYYFAVDKKYSRTVRGQGKGLGRILLYYAFIKALELYPKTSMLLLEPTEEGLLFYPRFGFSVIHDEHNFFCLIWRDAIDAYIEAVQAI
jgi:GNAT superfamily N-acetyltransferase